MNVISHSVPLKHPMADEVSIGITSRHYCTFPYTVELAFFKGGTWVTDILSEFAPYTDRAEADTRVYGWVPLDVFATFLKNYGSN